MHRLDEKDPVLWEMARQRASFKRHLFTYVVMISFFWVIYLMSGNYGNRGIPWPVWAMVGWGIGLAFHFFKAYAGTPDHLAKKEYEKLKDKS
ncbi:MAG TPA: 2TM domain-containing protein [Bacteroidia bacterium]|nr:2TM domain-containing protein [Bacteroidia bacterium]HNT80641.1 2TM domain-containing protein [Bacteroidia bacterium]